MEGRHVADTPEKDGKSRKPWIIAGVAVAVVLAAYLGLCAWVGTLDTIFPNVSVAGVDVSGMTVEEAQEKLGRIVRDRAGELTYTLGYESWERSITGDQIAVDVDQSIRNAWDVGRGNFLTGGYHMTVHMMGTGRKLDLAIAGDDTVLPGLVEGLAKDVNSSQSAYAIEGDKLVMTKGPVATVDWPQTLELARTNVQHAFTNLFAGDGELKVRDTVGALSEGTAPDFDAIHAELYTEAKSAQMDPETFEITDHVVGVDFDVDALRAAYDRAAEGETFSIPVTITQPRDTKESLESKLFCDLLGESTTRVSGSANRKHNVKLAASACNGVIILPGETFSYNNTTGSRTADKGYKDAPTYVGGESVDNVGGGVCQPSSTIYHAVLHTTLEVVERAEHRYNTGYVPEGMDANVWYGQTDFRFKNNTDYPVKIVTRSYDANGKRYLNVKLYGTNLEGTYAVPRSRTYDRVVPGTTYKADPGVPRGTLVLDRKQNAYTGISAHTYRDIYDKAGKLIETQDMGTSKYASRNHDKRLISTLFLTQMAA